MKSLVLFPSGVPASFPAAASRSHKRIPTKSPVKTGADRPARFNGERCYFRVELEQRTRAWRDWRTQGLGASDAACVLEESPFKSAAALMDEKLAARVKDVDSPEIALGVALEPDARLAYCRETGADVEPACVQSTQHPWLRASLDGLSADGQRVVEIKCGRGAYWKTAKTGRPPTYYVAQLQHILAITGLPSIDCVCYFPPLKTIYLRIERDELYIERLIAAEHAFWREIEELRGGPRNTRSTRKAA